jgi:hypothetical protein
MKGLTKIFLFVSVLLTSCSYFWHPYALKDSSFINNQRTGAVVISVRIPRYGGYSVFPQYSFANALDGKHFTMLTGDSDATKVTREGGISFVGMLEFPAGEYEIYRWDLEFQGLPRWWEHSDKRFSIPFKVEPGKINYLGEIAVAGYRFEFRDMRDRDLTMLFKKHADLKHAEVVYQPLACRSGCDTRPEKGNHPLWRPRPQ